ncbi:hypothetical protein DRN97_07860 [Methanosarcinales archaeon]|nr:MAG: hypothetical protein DRN97_07860 [Methanosarcinales archaeon]
MILQGVYKQQGLLRCEKMYKYNTKILDVKPSTLDEGNEDHIIDAYIEVKVNNLKVWCFVPDWRTYFPYWPPYHSYGIGKTLVKNLIGKTIDLTFKFLNLKTELFDEKAKKIIPLPERKKPCDYILIGEVTNKEPFHREPEKFEYLQVDCGFIVNNLSVEKDKYKIGDYIQAEGRLDAYKVDEKEGYE